MSTLELYPRLVVRDADAALEFYASALGGAVEERYGTPEGHVHHAVVAFGPLRFAVKDADPVDPAPTGGAAGVIMAIYVDDADALAERMVAAGAEIVIPISDHDYGDRGGRVRDPFGHLWMVAQRIGDRPTQE